MHWNLLAKKNKTFSHPASGFDASSEAFRLFSSFLLNLKYWKLFVLYEKTYNTFDVQSRFRFQWQWRFVLIAIVKKHDQNHHNMLSEIYRNFNASIISVQTFKYQRDVNYKSWIFQNMHGNLMRDAKKFFFFWPRDSSALCTRQLRLLSARFEMVSKCWKETISELGSISMWFFFSL